MRGSPLVLLLCLSCGESPLTGPRGSDAIDRSASPGSSATTSASEVETDDRDARRLRIECECISGPIPAPPGKAPIASRAVVVAPGGAITRTTKFVGAPSVETTDKLDAAAYDDLEALAAPLYVKKRADADADPPEQPVPDGTVCTIRISRGAPTLTMRVPHPSSRPKTAQLVDALVKLLPMI